jgi:hypothetical protein
MPCPEILNARCQDKQDIEDGNYVDIDFEGWRELGPEVTLAAYRDLLKERGE